MADAAPPVAPAVTPPSSPPPRPSTDAAADATPADRPPASDAIATAIDSAPAGTRPAIVVVGFAGLRIVSRDLGRTWVDRVVVPGGAEHDVMGIAYANGLFVAVGWDIFTSPDGATWTKRVDPLRQFKAGLAYGNGVVVAAGGCAVTWRSLDSVTWTRGASVAPGNCVAGTSLRSAAFGDGQFAVGSDAKIVYGSKDGLAWSALPGVQTSSVAFCNGAFRDRAACPDYQSGHGVFIRFRDKSIERSIDAKVWQRVYTDPLSFYYGVAFGYAPP